MAQAASTANPKPSSASGGNGGGGDGGGDGGPSGASSVGDAGNGAPAGSTADHHSSAGDFDDAADTSGSGGGRHSTPAQEPAYASADSSRSKDTLATAMRIYRASRGDVSGAAADGASSRYALSEAA